MSNPLAIATVTATLNQVLTTVVNASGVRGALVKNLRPDDPTLAAAGFIGVNIFLYQISPNAAWRNADLPARRSDNTLLRRPQAPLDLNYLLTFYGDDATLDQQLMLGFIVRQFHANPVLSRADIRTAQTGALATSNLADQVELVRFTPVNFSLEELSKLWSVFLKTDYVLSVAYQASVVLIETDDTLPTPAAPVFQPRVTALPFSIATIDAVLGQPIELSSTLPTSITLVGHHLDPNDAALFITPGNDTPLTGMVRPGAGGDRLIVNLPTGLHAGVNTVRLTQPAMAPAPPVILSQSSAAAFMLRPVVSFTIGPGTPSAVINAVVSPVVGSQQQAFLLLKQATSVSPRAFVVPADVFAAGTTDTGNLTFTLAKVQGVDKIPAGAYFAHIRVDEAESRLAVDAAGNVTGPMVTLL